MTVIAYDVFCHICGHRYQETDPRVRFILTDHVWECADEADCFDRKASNDMHAELATPPSCWYCQGARQPCTCTEDCGTTQSPIGPCPASEAGAAILASYRKETPDA